MSKRFWKIVVLVQTHFVVAYLTTGLALAWTIWPMSEGRSAGLRMRFVVEAALHWPDYLARARAAKP